MSCLKDSPVVYHKPQFQGVEKADPGQEKKAEKADLIFWFKKLKKMYKTSKKLTKP